LYVVVLEFFIKIAQVKPLLIFTTYPKVFVVIYEVLKEGDDSLVGVAINAITSLASSWECKILLDIPTASITLNYEGKVCFKFNIVFNNGLFLSKILFLYYK